MTEATLDGVIVHNPVNYTLAPPPPVLEPRLRTCIVLVLKHPLYVKQEIDQFDHIFNPVVHQIRIHQIMTAVEPTGLTLEMLIFQIFDYRLIDGKAVGYKTLDG